MSNVNVITFDENGVCVSVKSVKEGYVLQANEMLAEGFDTSIMGKTYDSESGTFAFSQAQIKDQERAWRNKELARTDTLMLLPDYPNKEALTVYRQALRDWTSTDAFPDTRPTLGG